MTLPHLRKFLEQHLIRDIVPFWMKHAVDQANGGIFTCINDDGTLQSRDKYIWSQTRALWTFSALYNRISKCPDWLKVAHGLFNFLKKYGRDEKGYWVLCTDEKGKVLKGAESIVVDAFALMGLTEYIAVTSSEEARQIARETYHSVCERLARPGTYRTAPYPTPPGMKAHREYMQFSLAFYWLGRLFGDREMMERGLTCGQEVLDNFARWDRQVLLEYLTIDNQPQDTPAGRAMVPGHAIESAYFQILNFADAGLKRDVLRACEIIRWGLEKGWDPKYGGLFLGIDVDGKKPPYWKFAEAKIWWVHAEAMAACILAHEHSLAPWCLAWYWKIHEWSFQHFPVPLYGEWTQRLDRKGNKLLDIIALPVKDPFHLPRALIVTIESLKRISQKSGC